MAINIFKTWNERADREHEQAVIRIIIGTVLVIYFLSNTFLQFGYVRSTHLGWVTTFYLAAFSIVFWIITKPDLSVPRRVLGAIVDNFSISTILYYSNELVVPVFIVYLWVAFGNGFRFGRKYLYFSMVLSVFGFNLAQFFSNGWSTEASANISFSIGLIALPLYVASLLKRLENALMRAEAASQAKSNFLATMSHEIRTPLNGLIGLLDLLGITELHEKQQHYVTLMKDSSNWLLNVICDGLDYTKIEADELVLAPVPVDIQNIVSTISRVHREVARTKNILFQEDLTEIEERYVICDQTRLTQIINNLLNNACKFTDNGSVTLVVSSKRISEETAHLSIAVRDTGVGIADEDLEWIFSPFKQIQSKNVGLYGGTGLGLAISSRLLKLMGGELQVQSQLGYGATFSFHLDVPLVDYQQLPDLEVSRRGVQWMKQPRILLVEDNAINQEVASTYLSQLGCDVVVAGDGLEAIDLLNKDCFDLIFMDCQMPRMDGYETARKIRKQEEGHEPNIIIALTAHVTSHDRQKCLDAGMNDYMGKPYRQEELLNTLGSWLKPFLASDVERFMENRPEVSIGSREKVTQVSEKEKIHDLRNALGGVVGYVELAMLTYDSPEESECQLIKALKAVQEAVNVMETMG